MIIERHPSQKKIDKLSLGVIMVKQYTLKKKVELLRGKAEEATIKISKEINMMNTNHTHSLM